MTSTPPIVERLRERSKQMRSSPAGTLLNFDGEEAATTIEALMEALERMDKMHAMMMEKTNLGASWYDADTLREMNEAPIQAASALRQARGEQS